jgi:hypothetical protein
LFFSNMRSDSSQYSAEEEEREARERGEEELKRLTSVYYDTHPGVSLREARDIVISDVLTRQRAEQQRQDTFWQTYRNTLRDPSSTVNRAKQ